MESDSSTGNEAGLIRRSERVPSTRTVDRDEEHQERFLDSLPEDLRAAVLELIAILAGAESHNSFFGLSFSLDLIRMQVPGKIEDTWRQAEALKVLALLEPFVWLFDASKSLAGVRNNVRKNRCIDPTQKLTSIATHVAEVRAVLETDRPYSDEGRSRLQSLVDGIADQRAKLVVPAYSNYLQAAMRVLLKSVNERDGDIHENLLQALGALEALRTNKIRLDGDNPRAVKELLDRAHAALLEQAALIRVSIDEEPSLKDGE